jgi:type II secretory pathway component HofQ
MRAALILLLLARVTSAGDPCAPGTKHRGAAIDLDLVRADLHDVLRLLADTARLDLVVGERVTGAVTLKLKQVPWDAALCTIARVHHLQITLDNGILLVRN